MSKKRGTGPTSGKKSCLYAFLLPDGRRVAKRSFVVHSETAVAVVGSESLGYCFCGIHESKPEWVGPEHLCIEAKREVC